MHWIFKNKEYGKIVAVASIGLVNLWDVEGGLPQIDKYLYSDDPEIQGGACLAAGITCSRTYTENDPAYVLVNEGVESPKQVARLPSILGLGVAYADAQKANLGPSSPSNFAPPANVSHSRLNNQEQSIEPSGLELQRSFGLGNDFVLHDNIHTTLTGTPKCTQVLTRTDKIIPED